MLQRIPFYLIVIITGHIFFTRLQLLIASFSLSFALDSQLPSLSLDGDLFFLIYSFTCLLFFFFRKKLYGLYGSLVLGILLFALVVERYLFFSQAGSEVFSRFSTSVGPYALEYALLIALSIYEVRQYKHSAKTVV